jgi:hypothetical protein
MPQNLSIITPHLFDAGIIEKLLRLLAKGCEGELREGEAKGKKFAECSLKGCGKRAFVVKGWVDANKGPAVRFRAPWGRLSDGEMMWQASPSSDWEETSDEDIDLGVVVAGLPPLPRAQLTVKFTYKKKQYTAIFYTASPA